MLPGRSYEPDALLRIARRNRWVIVLPFVVVALGTWLVSRTVPDWYRSEALIQTIPQRVPETYVRATVTGRIEDRLQSLRQQVLNRPRLEGLIADFDLYAADRTTKPMEQIVSRMQRSIMIEMVQGDAFRISYVSDNPQTAMLVTARLASMIIDENVRDRESMAVGASEFFEAQLEDARLRLVEHEERLEQFRRTHAGELPSQLESNLQMLQSTQLQLHSLAESINRDRDRRLVLERTVADLKASAAPVAPEVVPTAEPEGPTPLDEARAVLRALRSRLTPMHPDVIRQERIVRDFERQAAEAPAPPSPAPTPGIAADELNRRARLRDAEGELANLDRQITGKQAEETRLRRVMTTYQARAEATPARESDLIALTRDYQTLQEMYRSLLSKKEESKLAASLEQRQIGEQFKILDPARVPVRPAGPNRRQINVLGALAGLLLGGMLVAAREVLDRTFRNDDEVKAALGLPVLAMVPFVVKERPNSSRRRVALALGTAAAVSALAALAWAFSERLQAFGL